MLCSGNRYLFYAKRELELNRSNEYGKKAAEAWNTPLRQFLLLSRVRMRAGLRLGSAILRFKRKFTLTFQNKNLKSVAISVSVHYVSSSNVIITYINVSKLKTNSWSLKLVTEYSSPRFIQ